MVSREDFKQRLAKDSFKFSAAHMSFFPDGKKEFLHGHNYYVTVTLHFRSHGNSSFFDFSKVKSTVVKLCQDWDEKVILATKNNIDHLHSEVKIRQDSESLEYTACGKNYKFPLEEVVLLETDNIILENLCFIFSRNLCAAIEIETKDLGGSLDFAGVDVDIEETRGQSVSVFCKPEELESE